MAAGLGAGLVEMLALGAGKLELASRLEADGAVGPFEGDDLAILLDRAPAILGHRQQEVADPARLVPGGRAVIGEAIDELLVLGADRPAFDGLLAAGEGGEQIVPALDRVVAWDILGPGRHGGHLAAG